MSLVATEQVLVVPTEVFHRVGYFQGFSTEIDRYLEELFSPAHTSYRPRGEMEQDPSYKQLIPYVIFCQKTPLGGGKFDWSIFQYTRGKGQGESRLHAKRSIGVGGHISVTDIENGASHAGYYEGLQRELDEEVSIETEFTPRCAGLINDDETEVGKVHLGVVHLYEVEQPFVFPKEDDLHDARFLPLDELRSHREELESWSRICLDALWPEA